MKERFKESSRGRDLPRENIARVGSSRSGTWVKNRTKGMRGKKETAP